MVAIPEDIKFPRQPRKRRNKWLGGAGLLGLFILLTTIWNDYFAINVEEGEAPPTGLRAFPGCEGFGCETTHGRNGVVCAVDTTDGGTINNTGAGSLLRGSFRYCLQLQQPRIIVFKTSGIIQWTSRTQLGAAQSGVAVFGQTAPGDGILIRGGAADDLLLSLSQNYGSDPFPGNFSNGVFQYLRWRHGLTGGHSEKSANNIYIWKGSNHVVFDHNSFTWAPDQQLGWTAAVGRNTHDVTIQRSILGEGTVSTHNFATLLTAGGTPTYFRNITFHHNLCLHSGARCFKHDTGSHSPDAGAQYINNVHYNNAFNFSLAQRDNSGCSPTVIDIIGTTFKSGPIYLPGRTPIFLEDHPTFNPGPCTGGVGGFYPVEIYRSDNARLDINGAPQAGEMIAKRYGAGPGWVDRTTSLATQPEFPVTIQTRSDAYSSVVLDQDVGATQPKFDSVDLRLVVDPEDGGTYILSNVPPTAAYPTMSTYDVPADNDNDGVPDAYELLMLAADPDCNISDTTFDQHAQIDCDGDGYVNVEDWAHSLEIPKYRTP